MEKATIELFGKGWKLTFENNKTMIINWPNVPKDWDKAIIDVKRMKGQPIQLINGKSIINKKEYASSNPKGGEKNETPMNAKKNVSAKAPYNFVPLNEQVLYPEDQKVSFDRYDPERNTGHIELVVKTLTPLMISKGVSIEGNKSIHDFVKIGNKNKPVIPGSSIRGLIRSLVGILSYSSLIKNEHFMDHALFYRGVADRAFMGIYQDKFFDIQDDFNYRPLAGYLSKNGNNYVIYPAELDSNSVQYYKVRNTSYQITIDPHSKKPIFKFDGKVFTDYSFESIYFKPEPKTLHVHNRYNNKTKQKIAYNLKYALVKEYSFTLPTSTKSFVQGTLVVSGGMATKKHDQWIINVRQDTVLLQVNSQVINDYKNDAQRDAEFDLIEKLKGTACNMIPCFYLTDSANNVISFGHTPLYRIKHSKTIQDAVHQNVDDNLKDFETILFGNTIDYASRLYFEDLTIDGDDNFQMDPTLIKILSSPKPTSHQYYLRQESSILKNWSSTEQIHISGIKQYWHKIVNKGHWEDNQPATASHAGYIKPVLPNKTFSGKLRFENLTDTELGALISAIELPEGCCHKIGMGKPYGLGSIKIGSKLTIYNKLQNYVKLLDSDGKWSYEKRTEVKDFKGNFSSFILDKLQSEAGSLWEVDRIKQLKAMLRFDENINANPDWLETTRYLAIQPYNEFKERACLDTPTEIIKKFI
jgi:CRISPR-associated protein (TIGR03986 family)